MSFADLQAFYKMVSGRTNRLELAERLAICRTTLWTRFLPFFNNPITAEEVNQLFPLVFPNQPWVLGLDGTWLHRAGAIMIYRDVTTGTNLWWAFAKSESFQNLVDDFYRVYLLAKVNPPSGIISDWGKGIVALVKEFFPDLPHQRCLAHLIREGRRLCPAGSPYIFTLKLRAIIEEVIFISDPSEYYAWSQKLDQWLIDYGCLLKNRSNNPETTKKWWYTHGKLRQAINLLTKNQESLFKYLHHSFLPKTNNSLEGVNSQLKQKLGAHRGMVVFQQVAFCSWALTFSRVKTPADLKKLWGYLKER